MNLLLLLTLAQPPAQPAAISPPPLRPLAGLAIHDPSPAHPFGRRHPDAPVELAEFEFMLGEFDCVDEIRGRDGKWQRTLAIWNAHYFLNGHGIQDVYWNDTFATSNVRLFDRERGKWCVNFFRAPTARVGAGVWEGAQEGSGADRKMVMWSGSPDRSNGSRLTFFDITEDGFEWRADSVRGGVATPTWTSSCRRRKPGRAANAPRFLGNDANPARPFGRRAIEAPAALDGLAFQVGAFVEGPPATGLRTGRWILNGWGVQTASYRDGRYESLIQLFDTATRHWRITRYRMPDYEWTVFDGRVERGKLTAVESLHNGVKPETPRSLRLEPVVDGYRVEVGGDGGEAVVCRRR